MRNVALRTQFNKQLTYKKMNKGLCGVCFLILFLMPTYVQSAGTSRGPKIINWTDEKDQSGGIDLLQQATKGESITTGRSAGAKPTPVQLGKPDPVKPSTTTVSTTTATVAVSPKEQQEATSAKQAATSASTLDIPLDVGTATSVQTTVKPVTAAPKTDSKQAEPAPATEEADTTAEAEEEAAADAELEYAMRLLEKSKQDATIGRSIPSPASKNKTATVPAANKRFNPNAFRPGVEWKFNKSNHFDIYTEVSTNGNISSSNMAMLFESSYQTLRRFIPWMMSNRVRVFVYQDHNSYLLHEPDAKGWARAVAYPLRGEIVVYDEPGHQQELKESFTHELTHIFTQDFFDKHKTGRTMVPVWLDEGLAVLVEDQAYNGVKGGPWNNDYLTLNFQRDPSQELTPFGSKSGFGSTTGFGKSAFGSRSGFGSSFGQNPGPQRPGGSRKGKFGRRGRPVVLTPFEEFMQENSLDIAEGQNKVQKWYLQAYLMVRFLLNPSGSSSPSNRMQFEQFTRLISEGEVMRSPSTGFVMKDKKGNTMYQPYDVEKALGRAYHYNSVTNFEDSFWRWLNK